MRARVSRWVGVVALGLIAVACAGTERREERGGPPPRPKVEVQVPRDSGLEVQVTDTSRLASDGEIRVRCTVPQQPTWKWYVGLSAQYAFDPDKNDVFVRDEAVWMTPEQQVLPEPGGGRTAELVFRCPNYDRIRAQGRTLRRVTVQALTDVPSPTVAHARYRDGSTYPGSSLLGGRYECVGITFDQLGRAGGPPVRVRLRNISGKQLPETAACARDVDTGRVTPWVTVPATPPGGEVELELPSAELSERVAVEMRWRDMDASSH